MIEKAQNKMQTGTTNKAQSGTPYFFPEAGITVYANSTEEALKMFESLKDNK